MKLLLPAFFFVLIISTAHTCRGGRSSLDAAAYIGWVEDPENGLCVSKKTGGLNFELQYTPPEYCVLREHATDTLSAASLKAACEELRDMQYFTFRISGEAGGDLLKTDAGSKEDFSERLRYFSSEMQKDLFLVEGSDTLSCLLFHFERAYGIDPRSTFVVGFPLGKKDGAGGYPCATGKTFFFDDHQLGAGPVLLAISSEKMQLLPSLNLP